MDGLFAALLAGSVNGLLNSEGIANANLDLAK